MICSRPIFFCSVLASCVAEHPSPSGRQNDRAQSLNSGQLEHSSERATQNAFSGDGSQEDSKIGVSKTSLAPKQSDPFPKIDKTSRGIHKSTQIKILGDAELLENYGEELPTLEFSLSLDQAPPPSLSAAPTPAFEPESDPLAALPGSSGFGAPGASKSKEPRLDGNRLGRFVALEQPESLTGSSALGHFYRALARLQQGEQKKVRIAVYGASQTAADVYPSYLRLYLQKRFGDGGIGFVAPIRLNSWHKPFEVQIENSSNWRLFHAQRPAENESGFFGLLGARAVSARSRDYTRLSIRSSSSSWHQDTHWELFYLSHPKGGRLKIRIGESAARSISTKASAVRSKYESFFLASGTGPVELRPAGNGEVKLLGVAIENQEPGVVVDTLGISGTRAANHLKWDQEIWSDNLRHRHPDLYLLAYGTNESADEKQPISDYRRNLRQVLDNFRETLPEASCLLISPGDVPQSVSSLTPPIGYGPSGQAMLPSELKRWVPRPRLLQIQAIQREIASEMGCAFWDMQAFMGGVGSMHQWSKSQPPMAGSDHIHLTRRGATRMGMALINAIMTDYQNSLRDGG